MNTSIIIAAYFLTSYGAINNLHQADSRQYTFMDSCIYDIQNGYYSSELKYDNSVNQITCLEVREGETIEDAFNRRTSAAINIPK